MNKIIINKDSVAIVTVNENKKIRKGTFIIKDYRVDEINKFLYLEEIEDSKLIELAKNKLNLDTMKDNVKGEKNFILICVDGILFATVKFPDKITVLELYKGHIVFNN